ncbi:MAG TPA: melibiose:sodium transporter MelB [Clostridium sp.]|nr:melibiose:sodium transporter MelB [Clostridium sp.]
MKDSKLSFKTKYSFGVGALGKDLCYSIMSSFLMIYLTDLVGIAPAFVGTLFLVARVWDAVNDPMMGMVVDNTRTRFGKFRPWIMIGTILNSVVLVLLFTKPDLSGSSLYVYFSVIYILWGMTYTMEDIPYWSMLPCLSKTPEEREKMSVIPRIFASSAWLIMGAFGLTIINKLGQGNDIKGYSKFAIVIAVIFIVTAIITCVNVKEENMLDAEDDMAKQDKKNRIGLKGMMKVILQNDQLKVFIGVVLCYNLVVQLYGGAAMYYFKYVTGNANMYSVFTACAGIAEIAGLFFFPMLTKTIGRDQVFKIAAFIPAVGLVLLLVSGIFAPTNAILIALSGAICKLGSGFTLGATTVMIADVIDYGEYKLGTRNESIIASFQTLLVKTASAVSGWLVGVGLTIVGYVPNVEQTSGTILGLRILMIGVPSVITIISYFIYKGGYKLKGQYHKEIMDELEKRREEKAA